MFDDEKLEAMVLIALQPFAEIHRSESLGIIRTLYGKQSGSLKQSCALAFEVYKALQDKIRLRKVLGTSACTQEQETDPVND